MMMFQKKKCFFLSGENFAWNFSQTQNPLLMRILERSSSAALLEGQPSLKLRAELAVTGI